MVLEHGVGAEDVQQRRVVPLLGLRTEELGHGTLHPRHPTGAGDPSDSLAEQIADLALDGDVRQPLLPNQMRKKAIAELSGQEARAKCPKT